MTIEIDGFTRTSFTHDGVTKDVYRHGSGPGIVVMSEIPGISPELIRFATRVSAEGFTVFMPYLFGTHGEAMSLTRSYGVMARVCVSREFAVLASNASSPVADWLRALCRHVHAELGGKGVGAIGMCMTGNFALSLMVDPAVVAPVLSQPALPLPLGRARRAALHISEDDLAVVKERCAAGAKVLGLRFTNDMACPPERFESLRSALGPAFEGIEIDSSPGNPWGIPKKAHSVVTRDLVDQEGHPTRAALDRVLSFFRERLKD